MKQKLILLSILCIMLNADTIKTLPIKNSELKTYVNKAQSTLSSFISASKNIKYKDANFLLKSKIHSDNNESIIHLWFNFIKEDGKYFYVKSFEIPSGFTKYKNKLIKLEKIDIEDWWIEDKGKLYGAYTVHYQRDKLNNKEKKDLDEYMGIDKYMSILP